MKKIIVTNGILLVIYLISNIVINIWLDDRINNNFTAPFFTFSMGENTYNVVNLGTSHGEVGFDWKNLEHSYVKGLNLGLSGKPFKYDYFLLKYYRNNIDPDAVILLPVSFHSLCMSQSTYSPIDSVYDIQFPLLGMVRLNYLWDFQSYPREYPSDEFIKNYTPNSFKPTSCDNQVLEQSTSYINEIAKMYPNLILITTPYYHDALADYSEFNDFYQTIWHISSKYNLMYFDYSRDERFYESRLFYDATHLNTDGREMFTRIVVNEIIEQFIS